MNPPVASYPLFRGDGVIEFVDKQVPEAGPGQLLVQCKANALCASDLGGFRRGSDVTMGHEIAGIVVQAGDGTTTPVGTPGVVFLMDFCGECRSCRLGLTNQCLQKRADYGFNRDGGYGPYTLINETVFFPIDPDLPFDEATMLLDIMGTGGHALSRGQLVHPDVSSLLVNGAGPIGLGVLAMAKLRFGADFPVLITDLVPYRLALAEEMGGLPINVATGSLADGFAHHGFTDVDLAVDATGKRVARRGALDVLAKRGVLVCVGHGEGLDLTVSPDLIATERAILGSEYFCYNELAANLDLLRQQRGYLGQIITHRYPVVELGAAFAQFIAGATGKVIAVQ
ncbi:MAG: alcohol dehydrogenase catalytic domain-containing protein [Caldilineaceae bacterium]|nr:alcohol dehydrogenase catalytic domain-containing protein [Caldilineaceae bacterium]